jgi:cation transport protein ChaC
MIRPDFSATRFEPYESESLPLPQGEFWVFGYGSLMWNPGFEVQQTSPARLYGYHRRLCLWSINYRGTARSPGLVLGLDRGGSCNGIALHVAQEDVRPASVYLQEREMLNNAYLPMVKKVYLQNGASVDALTFVSRQKHPQFAVPLTIAETVSVVLEAEGLSGKNCDYVLNTVQHLNECGINQTELHTVAEHLTQSAEIIP